MKKIVKTVSLLLTAVIMFIGLGCGNKTGDAHVHEYEWSVYRSSTCEGKGLMKGVCECGDCVFTEIDAAGHTYQNGICIICDSDYGHVHEYVFSTTLEPTCEVGGKLVGTCYCGSMVVNVIKSLGHNFVNGICNRCQAVESGKFGYSMEDIYNKCFSYGFVEDEVEVDVFLRGLKITNLYVNKLGLLKATFNKNGDSYCVNLGSVRKELPLTATNQEYVTALSITNGGALTLSYESGLIEKLGFIKESYKQQYSDLGVIKSIAVNTNNCMFLIYTDDSVRSVGKINSNSEDVAVNNVLYDYSGTIVVLDYTVSYIAIEERIANVKLNGIADGAFYGANEATTIFIPASIKLIEYGVFGKESKLTTVRYGGSKEEWEKIRIAGGNSIIKNANIIYDCES